MITEKKVASRALLALAFAGGLLDAQAPILAADIPESSEAAMQSIVTNASLTRDIGAIDLIKLAEGRNTKPAALNPYGGKRPRKLETG